MEHLALEVFDLTGSGSKFANLPKNTTIRIRRTSQVFGSGAVFTHEIQLNIHANLHLFGTSGEIHGSRLHEQINKRKARIWAEGLPLYLGYLRLSDEVEVDGDGNVGVSFESGQHTFDEMIEGAKANQVPMMSDVLIGMALWRKRWTKVGVKLMAYFTITDYRKGEELATDVTVNGGDTIEFECDGEKDGNSVQEYPRMVFPRGHFVSRDGGEDWDENCLNTDYPYDDGHPFCNVALCYQKYDYQKKTENGGEIPGYSGEPEAQREYEYMPADRVNSAPNFFVIYWLRALMKHLGILIEENQMMDVEDLRRLFFVNTNCDYDVPQKLRSSEATADDLRYGRYRYHFDGPISLGGYRSDSDGLTYDRIIPEYFDSMSQEIINSSLFTGKNIRTTVYQTKDNRTIESIGLRVREVVSPTHHKYPDQYKEKNNYFHRAYATSECFPDADISEVIKALESGFGVRLLFSDDYRRVKIVLLRNILNSSDVQDIVCDIVGQDVKQENSIRGFRMTYGESEDTQFYYKGFADLMPHKKPYFTDNSDKHDYSKWNLTAEYDTVVNMVSAFNKTCYVTPATGNAYGIKVDKNAKKYNDLHPSLFEFVGFQDAEDGDCSGEEDTIETINVGFKPAIMNDVNKPGDSSGQRFALFVDETMRPRRVDLQDLPSTAQPGVKSYDDPTAIYDINKMYAQYGAGGTVKAMTHDDGIVAPGEFAIASDMYALVKDAHFSIDWAMYYGGLWNFRADATFDAEGAITEGYRLYLQDNYEPNDDGISPIETHDWGLTLGIMRGTGDDAYINYWNDPDDGEGNDTWDVVPGSSATAHHDTCDNYGKLFEYIDTKYAGRENAAAMYEELFPNANATFTYVSNFGVMLFTVADNNGIQHNALFVTPFPSNNSWHLGRFRQYINYLGNHTVEEIKRLDAEGYMDYQNTLVAIDSSQERCDTLRQLIRLALGYESDIIVNHGVSSKYGRFSLKLRAEKPNPYFNPKEDESATNRRYLSIDNKELRGRGLCDQFYKEYSYWIRNARIAKRSLKMELAQLLTIDDTVRVTVGDVTGFVKEMEYDIGMQTGLGIVTMDIMYI